MTQDSRSHLLNSQKQHVVAILDSLIFQWTSKAIACRWLIYLANNKHGKPRASRVKVLVIKSCRELWDLRWFGPVFCRFWLVWAGLDQFGFFDMQEHQWRVGRVGNCHPDFGRIEGATRQWRSAKLLLPTQFRQLLRPLNYNVLQLYHKALRVTLLQGLLAEHTSG